MENQREYDQDDLNMEINLENIEAAYAEIKEYIDETPLVRFHQSNPDQAIYLKLETFQYINSYKIRSALNVCLNIKKNENILQYARQNGIVTASAGNFSQGICYALSLLKLDVPLYLAVPSNIPETKLKRTLSLYSNIKLIKIKDRQKWMNIVFNSKFDIQDIGEYDGDVMLNGIKPIYLCPTSHPLEVIGNGSIALEIFQKLKNIECILIPWGGGGLATGIAKAAKSINPNIKIYACEASTASPLKSAFESGKIVIIDTQPSFVDGIGSPTLLERSYKLAKELIEDSLVTTPQEIAKTVKLLMDEKYVIAEGAGASTLSAYLKFKDTVLKDYKSIVCIISGGNIDNSKILSILNENFDL